MVACVNYAQFRASLMDVMGSVGVHSLPARVVGTPPMAMTYMEHRGAGEMGIAYDSTGPTAMALEPIIDLPFVFGGRPEKPQDYERGGARVDGGARVAHSFIQKAGDANRKLARILRSCDRGTARGDRNQLISREIADLDKFYSDPILRNLMSAYLYLGSDKRDDAGHAIACLSEVMNSLPNNEKIEEKITIPGFGTRRVRSYRDPYNSLLSAIVSEIQARSAMFVAEANISSLRDAGLVGWRSNDSAAHSEYLLSAAWDWYLSLRPRPDDNSPALGAGDGDAILYRSIFFAYLAGEIELGTLLLDRSARIFAGEGEFKLAVADGLRKVDLLTMREGAADFEVWRETGNELGFVLESMQRMAVSSACRRKVSNLKTVSEM